MKPTDAVERRSPGFVRLLLGVLFAALALSLFSASPAHADAVGGNLQYQLVGNVQNDQKPLKGVKITAKGDSGFTSSVKTDEKGQWSIGVPRKGKYQVSLDESTLPKHVIVVKGGATTTAEFGLTDIKAVNFFLGKGEHVTTDFAGQLFDRVVNGLQFGLMLALAAIGLSLIFGTTGLSNFAHSEMITFGALMTLTFSSVLGWPLWIGIIIALVLSAGLGWSLDAVIWKPLRRRGVGLVQMMIVSIGLSLAIRYVYQYFYGGSTRQLPGATLPSTIRFAGVALSWVNIGSMVISLVVLGGVAYFLLRTRTGKATRAVSDNPSLAAASGIDVDRVIRIVWVLGGTLAGLSGILYAYYRPGVAWDMGFQILLLVFAAVTLGGLGTAFGALVGSMVVGLFVEISTLWLPSDLKYVGALVVLILVLLFRPQGILGRKERIG